MTRLTRRICLLVMLVAVTMLLTGCAAGMERFSADQPAAGFWMGLWHGAISVVTLIIHIFDNNIHVYEVNNTGGWYDFGFLLGVICIWGGSTSGCMWSKSRKKKDDQWGEVCEKVEDKIKSKMRKWAQAEPDEDWDEVEKKLEHKLRDKLKKWAESDD